MKTTNLLIVQHIDFDFTSTLNDSHIEACRKYEKQSCIPAGFWNTTAINQLPHYNN